MNRRNSESRSRRSHTWFWTLFVLLAPVVVDIATSIRSAPFRYVASDAFYYLVIGRNWARTGVYSFDGEHATNGFHPLWQWVVGIVFEIGNLVHLGDYALLVIDLGLSVLLVTVGVVLIGRVVERSFGKLPRLFVAYPVGAYALVILPLWIVCSIMNLTNPLEGPVPLYGTMWSYMNGMETGLVILSFGLLAHVFVTDGTYSKSRALALGIAAAVLALSRLDHVFISLSVLTTFSWPLVRVRGGRDFGRVLLAWIGFAAPLGAYLAYAFVTFGTVVPYSGMLKSTFPVPTLENLIVAVNSVRHLFAEDLWLDRVYRLAQMTIPAAVAAVGWWTMVGKSRISRLLRADVTGIDPLFVRFLTGVGAGVIILGLQNFFFVRAWQMGHWYFPVSVCFVSLVLLLWMRNRKQSWVDARFAPVVIAMSLIVVFLLFQRRPEYHRRLSEFYWNEAPRLRAHYGDVPPRMIEHDDGIIGYATGYPTFSGTLLAIDRAAHDQLKKGSFFQLVTERGYDHLVTLEYVNLAKVDLTTFNDYGISSDSATITLDYCPPDSSFGVVRFARK